MTELSSEILRDHQVRKTYAQKTRFIEFFKQKLPELHIETYGKDRSRNLILGDPASAEVVLGAHYDTAPGLIFPNFIAPKKPWLVYLYSFLLFLPGVILYWIVRLLTDSFLLSYPLLWGYILVLLVLMLAGPANKHTANDNTSGVITLCEIYAAMPPDLRARVAFVFFDNEEKGLIGSRLFRKKYKTEMAQKPLLNFDCVSDGDHLLCVIPKRQYAAQVTAWEAAFAATVGEGKCFDVTSSAGTMYPSDQKGFPIGIAFAAMHKARFVGYYMSRIHTSRDVVFDERNVICYRDAVLRWIGHRAEGDAPSADA